ncbi:hypothetical protein TGARI_362170 [Toxoplasma gondii ARI]|uniref:Uncharacterized protein n=1 Tax=Toxoplasma gondii ARI TaxID=1074872 RepID=A0A139Y2W8_TOXGO|nr:hypothetical protein TGARI_362170 [Toxoplasma gondii ARI]
MAVPRSPESGGVAKAPLLPKGTLKAAVGPKDAHKAALGPTGAPTVPAAGEAVEEKEKKVPDDAATATADLTEPTPSGGIAGFFYNIFGAPATETTAEVVEKAAEDTEKNESDGKANETPGALDEPPAGAQLATNLPPAKDALKAASPAKDASKSLPVSKPQLCLGLQKTPAWCLMRR